MNKKRQQLLSLIRVEVAQEGKITALALRIHIENRCISRSAMMEAAREGMAIYERMHPATPAAPEARPTGVRVMGEAPC